MGPSLWSFRADRGVSCVMTSTRVIAERKQTHGDDLRQLRDQHHHALEAQRPGGARV